MNKLEKVICLVLGGILAWYIFVAMPKAQPARPAAAAKATVPAAPKAAVAPSAPARPAAAPTPVPDVPEQRVALENGELKLEVSSWGASVRRATLKEYARGRGAVSAENPAVSLDFADAPLGAVEGLAGLAANAAYAVRSQTSNEVVLANGALVRRIVLEPGYRVRVEDAFAGDVGQSAHALALGAVRMGDSKNDLLSVDSLAADGGKGKPQVIHHGDDDSPLKSYLAGGLAGGCSGSSSAAGMPAVSAPIAVGGRQEWIALKNRFFVVALASCDQPNTGFSAEVRRDLKTASYRPESVCARAQFAGTPQKRTSVFYVGPKKQARLWDLGMRDVMEFGMWRWICYPLVWVLNFFNGLIPNYGVAIILLTVLVRILFWPLTHKSTVGMKKMQEIQPLMKELQQKFKDNPQRLQQETFALYREHKVNPMSSCLPMLIQIPVFIALFNVLRSAVELRYAPFLWIGDLSEPEALFAGWFPFGGLNVLPLLMAASTALQSAFTPAGGDPKQQRMMMVMMPAMMLVMFYSFPSALSLYWFLSNVFSIVQTLLIRRQGQAKASVVTPEVIDPPTTTRQMRRHS